MDTTILVFLGLIMIMLIGIFALLNMLVNKKEESRPELSLPDWNRTFVTPAFRQGIYQPMYIRYRDYMNDPESKRKSPNQIRKDWGFSPLNNMESEEIKPTFITDIELQDLRKQVCFNRMLCKTCPDFVDSEDLYYIVGQLTDQIDKLTRVLLMPGSDPTDEIKFVKEN